MFSIGMFDDAIPAVRSIRDALLSGVSKRDITVVMSDDEARQDSLLPRDVTVVHPTSDTQRAYVGGAGGAAVGGLIGALTMYALNGPKPEGFIPLSIFIVGAAVGLASGMGVGALVARSLPQCKSMRATSVPLPDLGRIASYDLRRSAFAGAIGAGFGAMVGVVASYLMGIATVAFFFSAGLWAGMASLIVGGLIGGMSGRGLSPRAVGEYENLADSGNSVLVSIQIPTEKRAEIERLMLNDGAKLVRVA